MKNDKLKEFLGTVICIVVVVCIGFYTGFIKSFNLSDIGSLLDNTTEMLSQGISNSGIRDNSPTRSSGSKKVQEYNGYKPSMIPADMKETSLKQKVWTRIFASQQKVIFYLYDSDSDEFHKQIDQYVLKNQLIAYYHYEPSKYAIFRNIRFGDTVFDKVCNSLEECNSMREHAAKYTALSAFLERCGKTMCIFNPRNGQFIQLKTRNPQDAIKMINALKSW